MLTWRYMTTGEAHRTTGVAAVRKEKRQHGLEGEQGQPCQAGPHVGAAGRSRVTSEEDRR